MLRLINISTTNPTVKSPAAFFTSFFNSEKISEAKKSFLSNFPNPNDENDYWNQFCVTVLEGRDSFMVEYFFDASEEDQKPPETNSVVVTYTFGSELEKLFRDNFQLFKMLINEKLKDTQTDKRKIKAKTEYVKDLQTKLISIGMNLEGTPEYQDIKDVLLRPLYAIMRFIYNHFGEYALNPNVDPFLRKALESRVETLHFIDEPISLDKLLGISTIKNLDGSPMFQLGGEGKGSEKSLRFFFYRELEKIKSPIHIWGQSMKVDYLIHKICGALNYAITDIASRKIFFNNSVCLTPDCCYSNTARIGSSPDGAKDIIDIYFSTPNLDL
jgi:hypothetical protein